MNSLLEKLIEKNITVGSVESMTAGLFASEIGKISGASKSFKGSIVSYSCSVKESLVKVRKSTIKKYGVVSSQVAEEMARNGRKLLGVDFCVSITGNAGPTTEPGGKPVGCFYVGLSNKSFTTSEMFQINGERNDIRNKAVVAMRDLLIKYII